MKRIIETAATVYSVYAVYQEHAKLFTNIYPFSSHNSPRR